jgi:tetratricopeptide (TPR) repeat protein
MDMSPAALNDALVKEAADPGLAMDRRVQALMQLAGLDYAHKRYPQAIEKYGLVFDYYARHEAPAMQAIALQGVGDCLVRTGDRRGAKLRYQQGLTLAAQAQALPVLLNLTSALGEITLELGEHREADGFFGLAAQLAGRLLNPFAKADAQEKQGIARQRAGDVPDAVVVWRDAAKLAQTFNYHERRCSVLSRLVDAYRSIHVDGERRLCEDELELARRAAKAARDDRERARREG